MQMKASDLSARLLATENLSVIRARTRTASFDIKSRVLTLPMWKDMTPEIEDMLIGHEVGHALYTGEQYMVPIRENPKMMSYLNVLEDVRIEKLIKRKYPGLRKKMNEGYKQLNDRDFFGVKQVPNFDSLLLIDKINLYFKAGFQCGVTFDPDEKTFVNRAERTESVEDVIALAQDIWTYSKEKAEERKQKMQAENPQDAEDEEDPIEQDFDIDPEGDWEQEDNEEDNTPSGEQSPPSVNTDEKKQDDDEEDLESKTERAFANKLEDLADESTEYIYWKFDSDYLEDPIISYRRVMNETRSPENWDEEITTGYLDYRTRYMTDEQKVEFHRMLSKDFESFKTESTRTVNYLVKEFEMKKSAQLYKRAQTAKIGSLDMKKIYAYKLQDDLFKRVTTIPKGKNHGMIMLVDWSGSMNDVLQDTLKQVINLAMFCNRVQIPYRVFAFTTGYNDDRSHYENMDQYREKRQAWIRQRIDSNQNILATGEGFHLLELFNEKMTTSEFNNMAKRVLDYRFTWNKGYNTSGTPLNEALVWVYHNIGNYIKKSGIEKMTFITLTDGEGGAMSSYGRRYMDDTRTEIVAGEYKRIKIKNLIRDEVTQKTYELPRQGCEQTEVILRMMKDRYGIAVVGFHICENRRGDLGSALRANLPTFQGDQYSVIESWRKDFKAQGFTALKNTGRDELFIIPQSSTKIEEGEMDVKADANAKVIAKNFSKFLNVKKTSRILLNRFIALVA